jgi:hypothetical protein
MSSAQGRTTMTDVAIDAAKGTPPASVLAFIWFGHTPAEWLTVLMIVWTVLLIVLKIRDELRKP